MAKDARARAPEPTIENLAAMTEAIAEIPEKRQDGLNLEMGKEKGQRPKPLPQKLSYSEGYLELRLDANDQHIGVVLIGTISRYIRL